MKEFSEMRDIRELAKVSDDLIQCEELTRVSFKGQSYPVLGFKIGSDDPKAPCLGLFGGVHGLEKVGTHVVTNYLNSLFKQLKWDQKLRDQYKNFRLVSIPLINPGGMANNNRSNPNGVDLMRNAPIDGDQKGLPLLSGHRISNLLPWYRGEEQAKMEVETQAVCDFVNKYMFNSKTAMSIDFHSGFGMRDRLWYPWGRTQNDFPHIKQVQNIIDLLDETLPYHIYITEPQSASYIINGDLWDYLYAEKEKMSDLHENIFIPWTLEMGSWMWVKKNPIQIFSRGGLFNPIKSHRFERTMRRHLLMINFFQRATQNANAWNK